MELASIGDADKIPRARVELPIDRLNCLKRSVGGM
jgi:hypothetical protein